MEENTEIHIAICINDSYVIPATVLVESIVENKGDEKITIHIVSRTALADSTKLVLDSFLRNVKIKYHIFDVSNCACHFVEKNCWWPPEVFLKLYIPEILPDLSKVLVLDADMIVRHSLLELWNVDISDCALAGVVDTGWGVSSSVEEDMYYDFERGYLNGGLWLINVDYHRSHSLSEKYLEWMKEHLEKISFLEQTIINNVISDSKRILPLKYNLQFKSFIWKRKNNRYYSDEERADAYFDPTIVHFIGFIKPWHRLCPHPFLNEWNRYLRKTHFKGYRKSSKTQNKSLTLRQILLSLSFWINGRVLGFLRIFKIRWI